MIRYKAILFDFDRTLWDVGRNQKNAQKFVYEKYNLNKICDDFDHFYDVYLDINDRLWLEYRDGKVKREYLRNHRFIELLGHFGVQDKDLAQTLSDEYIYVAPTFNQTIPHSLEVVQALAAHYPLHIITNGFNEVQQRKLRNCGLDSFFGEIVTSEDAGANKPDRRIFEYALKRIGATASQTIVIGDDLENDILGAINAGIDCIYFNPKGTMHDLKPTLEVRSLIELIPLLCP